MENIKDIAEEIGIEIAEVPGCGTGHWSKQEN